jgi:hypothetical protein
MKTVYLIGCIKRDVMRWVHKYSPENKVDLSEWCCGLTHFSDFTLVDKMLMDKGFANFHYRHWYANDGSAAHEIIGFYVKNGMKTKPPKGGYKNNAKYFFIFRAQPKTMEEILVLLS